MDYNFKFIWFTGYGVIRGGVLVVIEVIWVSIKAHRCM